MLIQFIFNQTIHNNSRSYRIRERFCEVYLIKAQVENYYVQKEKDK